MSNVFDKIFLEFAIRKFMSMVSKITARSQARRTYYQPIIFFNY
jgi:hypothetical protein